jgi:hypothetical protein
VGSSAKIRQLERACRDFGRTEIEEIDQCGSVAAPRRKLIFVYERKRLVRSLANERRDDGMVFKRYSEDGLSQDVNRFDSDANPSALMMPTMPTLYHAGNPYAKLLQFANGPLRYVGWALLATDSGENGSLPLIGLGAVRSSRRAIAAVPLRPRPDAHGHP